MAKSFYEQKCRICGCDWNHACNDHDYWFAEDLCSACAEAMKPILFNTPMVQAIQENRKTNTRWVVKRKGYDDRIHDPINDFAQNFCDDLWEFGQRWENRIAPQRATGVRSPFQPGDILYVRETWCRARDVPGCEEYHYENGATVSPDEYCFKAGSESLDPAIRWHPSIHMPRKAARIFLRVTDVKAERLQDINGQGNHDRVLKEGYPFSRKTGFPILDFMYLWDSTIKKSDLGEYGWKANPWVWVISFEHCEEPKEESN